MCSCKLELNSTAISHAIHFDDDDNDNDDDDDDNKKKAILLQVWDRQRGFQEFAAPRS